MGLVCSPCERCQSFMFTMFLPYSALNLDPCNIVVPSWCCICGCKRMSLRSYCVHVAERASLKRTLNIKNGLRAISHTLFLGTQYVLSDKFFSCKWMFHSHKAMEEALPHVIVPNRRSQEGRFWDLTDSISTCSLHRGHLG